MRLRITYFIFGKRLAVRTIRTGRVVVTRTLHLCGLLVWLTVRFTVRPVASLGRTS